MKAKIFCIKLIGLFFWYFAGHMNVYSQDRNISVNENYPTSMFKENGGKFINVKNLVAAGIYHTNAVGDGVADDSDAIIAAMTWVQNRLKDHYVNVQPVQVHWHELWTIYLPNGVYRVTKPLVYGGGRVPDPLRLDHADREGSQKILLVGQSRENTIIKLDNNASAFQSGGFKPVVAFARFDLSPAVIFNNMPSGNQIRNITIDTGTGNPNAIGLEFCGANTSRLDNIKVIGSGRIGIHMRTGTTAGYQSNITVEGFDYGIYLEGYSVNHAVMEYVTLVNQGISGVYITIGSASMRKVHSTNSVTGVTIEKGTDLSPHMVITDSEFTGGGSSPVFNISNGHLFARNITVGGYGVTVTKNGANINSGSIQEYVSDTITTYSNDRVRSSAIKSMNLPVEEYPIVQWESNFSQWANVDDYGAIGNGTTDDRAAIQAAMNSGKPVVYFPKMRYLTSGTVTVPPSVKQIIGSNVQILGSGDKFSVSQASGTVLLFYYINLRSGGTIRHSAQRDILMESTNSHSNGYVSDLTQTGTKLFVNNAGGFARTSGSLKNIDVWVRWDNNEKHDHYQFNVGPGCNFWMMGFKSEGTYSVFDVEGGSRLEVLGGILSRFGQIPPNAPAIGVRNVNSHISIIAGTQGPNRDWGPMITDSQGGTTKTWQMNHFPGRGIDENIAIPLYASYDPATVPTSGPSLPSVSISATDATAAEAAANPGVFTITRSNTTGSLTVNYTISGTATNGTDYSSITSSVTMASGVASATVTITPTDDSSVEGNETAILTLSSNAAYTIGTPSSATVTIADNDGPPVVSVIATDANAAEPSNPGVFTISRDKTTSSLTVNYAISGTATNGTDYASVSSSVTMATGVASATVTIAPIDDSSIEGNESVILTLSSNAAYTIGTPSNATVTIEDNDVPACPDEQTLTVGYKTNGAISVDGNLNESSWCISNSVTKSVIGTNNNTMEFSVVWDDTYLYVGAKVLDGNLYNESSNTWEDDAVEIYIDANHNAGTTYDSYDRQYVKGYNDASLLEKTGKITGVLHATGLVSGGYTVELAIPWNNLAITPSNNLVIGFDIGNNDDDNGGTRENQTVWNGTSSNWTNTSAFGDLRISTQTIGGPSLPSVSIAASDVNAAEQGQDPGVFTITRTGATTASLVVNYAIGGTAAAGDYTPSLSGTATIASGSASTAITITPFDDSSIEGSETVVLTLISNAAYTIGTPSNATVTITDNDALPVITVSATDANAAEAAANPGIFTISRNNTSGSLTVNYTIGGTATNGTDYTSVSSSVTMASGVASATVTVTPTDDSSVEGNETVILTLSSNSAYTIGTPSNATVTIADNDVASTSYVYIYNVAGQNYLRANSATDIVCSSTQDDRSLWSFSDAGDGYEFIENKYYPGLKLKASSVDVIEIANETTNMVKWERVPNSGYHYLQNKNFIGQSRYRLSRETNNDSKLQGWGGDAVRWAFFDASVQRIGIYIEENAVNYLMYPNPLGSSNLTIKSNGGGRVKIMNLRGQVIMDKFFDKNEITISRQLFHSGIYLVSLTSQEGVVIEKIFVK